MIGVGWRGQFKAQHKAQQGHPNILKLSQLSHKAKQKNFQLKYLQQLVTICLPKARRSSDEASSSCKRHRTLVLDRARTIVSGGSSSAQMRDEMTMVSQQKDLQNHLKGLQHIHIPHGDLLSLKANMCFSWKRNRDLKRLVRCLSSNENGSKSYWQQYCHLGVKNMI